jgi:hypothetical protein
MILKSVIRAVVVLFLCGCTTAKIVGHSTSPDGMSQITYRYSTRGGDNFSKARKDDAILKAKASCGGDKVKVVSESTESERRGMYEEEFAVIVFECLFKKADAQVY